MERLRVIVYNTAMSSKKFSPFSKRTEAWSAESNPLSAKLLQVRDSGQKILDLTISNPTRCEFSQIQKNFESLNHPQNSTYEPDAHGLLEARRAICRYYKKQHSAEVHENQVFITANTSEAYSFVFKLLTDPGDSILVPKPSYPLLHYLAQLHDLRLEHYSLPENIRATDARALLLIHPNNPTGNYVSDLPKTDIPLIADEVFLDYSFNGKRKTFATHQETLCFTLSGISKILGLPQMKISWIIVSGPEKLRMEAIQKLEVIADTYLSAGTPAQNALPAWLEQTDKIQNEIRARISKNAHFAMEKLAGSSVKPLMPEGGWSMILKMPEIKSDEEWALFLLEGKGVLAHPGFLFDFEEDSILVISLLVQEEIFRAGIERILEAATSSLSS